MAGTGRGHPPGTAAPPRDGRAPARRTAPTDHAAVPSRRPRAGARERVRGRGGPPHARGSEAQRRGERDDPGPAPGGVGRPGTGRAGDDTPRQRARRERRTAAAPQDERRRRRGPGRREKAGRARSQTRGRGGRGGRDDDDTRTGLPLEGREGGRRGPRRSDGPGPRGRGESSTGAPAAATGGEKARKRGVSHRQAPNPVRWRFPTRDAPSRRTTTTGPEESPDAPRPADPPPRRGRRTPAKPPSLARFPETARSLPLAPSRTDPPPRQTRPPPPKEGPPAATGPDASGDAPGDDRPPFSPKAAPEREVTTPQSQNRIPDPEEGRVNRCSPNVGTLPGRGSEATSTRHATRATHARDARDEAAVRGNGKDGEAREGPLAAGTDGGRVGPGSPPPPKPRSFFPLGSAPRPRRRRTLGGAGESGSRGTRACAHAAPSFPTTGNTSQAPTRTARRRHDTLSRPAWFLPGLGARRRGPQRETRARVFPPQRRDAARGTRPKLRASGGQGVPGRPQARPLIGSLEKAIFLTEGGRDGPGPTSLRPRQRKSRGSDTRTPLDDLERGEAGGPAVSVRLSLPLPGAFLSVRGQGGPHREKAYYRRGSPESQACLSDDTHRVCTRRGRHSVSHRQTTFNGDKKTKKAGRDRSTPPDAHRLNGRRRRVVGRSPDLTGWPRESHRLTAERPPLLPLASTPFLLSSGPSEPTRTTHTSQRKTAKGRTARRRHTRQRTGKRRHRSEPGTSEDRPGTLQEHREDRKRGACTRARSGGARDAAHRPTLPRLGGRRAKRTTHVVAQRNARRGTTKPPGAPHRNPHEPQRGVRGGFHRLGPDNRTPAFHTPPVKVGRRDEGPAGRTRRAAAIRHECPSLAWRGLGLRPE